MSEIIITKPNPEKDVEEIANVYYYTWLETYPNEAAGITREDLEEHFKNRLENESLEKRKRSISNTDPNKMFLVAKDNEKVVGVCNIIKRESFNQLQSIYVLPEYQEKGIGYKLWLKAFEFADKEKDTVVQVAIYNENAINFYKKLGFIDTGKRFSDEKFKMPISGALIPEMEMILKKENY